MTDRLCSAPPDSNLAITAGLWSQVSCWALSACLGDYRSSRYSTDNVAVWGAPPWSVRSRARVSHQPHKHNTAAQFTEEAWEASVGTMSGWRERIRSHVLAQPTSPNHLQGWGEEGGGVRKGALEDSIFRKPGLEDPRQTDSSDTTRGFSHFPGAISWGTATPMDVVKSRIQADGVYLNKYRGVVDCISQSYRQEGFKVSCAQPPWVSSSLAEGSCLWW